MQKNRAKKLQSAKYYPFFRSVSTLTKNQYTDTSVHTANDCSLHPFSSLNLLSLGSLPTYSQFRLQCAFVLKMNLTQTVPTSKMHPGSSPQFSCGTQLNIWPCMSVCLSVCPKFCPNFFYIIEEAVEVDELNKGNISAAAGKKDK